MLVHLLRPQFEAHKDGIVSDMVNHFSREKSNALEVFTALF